MSLALILALVFAASVVIVIALGVVAVCTAVDETDDYCDMVDQQLDPRVMPESPETRLLAAVNGLGDEAERLWSEPAADVIRGPWKPRRVA